MGRDAYGMCLSRGLLVMCGDGVPGGQWAAVYTPKGKLVRKLEIEPQDATFRSCALCGSHVLFSDENYQCLRVSANMIQTHSLSQSVVLSLLISTPL